MTATITLTDFQVEALRASVRADMPAPTPARLSARANKIMVIKMIRDNTNLSLYEAKILGDLMGVIEEAVIPLTGGWDQSPVPLSNETLRAAAAAFTSVVTAFRK